MNTLFEIIVDGDDLENDIAAAEAALDEITRIETVLSRFDPSSEVARVNREAHQHPVLISYELLEILETCRSFWEKTLGYFDITAESDVAQSAADFQSAESLSNAPRNLLPDYSASPQHEFNVVIDSGIRKISFAKPSLRLDFGAFGKGYALDCAAQLLKENGVRNALLHGGTSSVLAFGNPVRVGLRNPWNEAEEIDNMTLEDQGLSSSAVFHLGQETSDIINPHEQTRLRNDAACVVIGATAAEAEVFSTALLCMGRERSEKFCVENLPAAAQVFWIEQGESGAPVSKRLSNSPGALLDTAASIFKKL